MAKMGFQMYWAMALFFVCLFVCPTHTCCPVRRIKGELSATPPLTCRLIVSSEWTEATRRILWTNLEFNSDQINELTASQAQTSVDCCSFKTPQKFYSSSCKLCLQADSEWKTKTQIYNRKEINVFCLFVSISLHVLLMKSSTSGTLSVPS